MSFAIGALGIIPIKPQRQRQNETATGAANETYSKLSTTAFMANYSKQPQFSFV